MKLIEALNIVEAVNPQTVVVIEDVKGFPFCVCNAEMHIKTSPRFHRYKVVKIEKDGDWLVLRIRKKAF